MSLIFILRDRTDLV